MAPTILQRIVIIVVGIELSCATCFSGLALAHEWRSRLRAIDSTLQGRSDSLLGAVQDQEDPADHVFVDPRELQIPERDLYAVYNRNGDLLAGKERAATGLTQRAGDGFRSVRPHGESYRVFEREGLRIIDREESGGVGLQRPITIVYAIPTSRLLHETLEAAGFYVMSSLVLAGSTALVLLAALKRLLSPIRELADAASGISAASLTFDAPPSALRLGELRPLAMSLADTMQRLREAFDKQHRFVGDAAHELKTAVAVVRSSVQVLNLRGRSQEEYRDGLDQILTDNERVEELVARMLLLARLEEGAEHAQEGSDLGSEVERALVAITSLAAARNVVLKTQIPILHMSVRLSPFQVATLTSNLVVNAIQHSPPNAVVTVRVRQHGTQQALALLEVIDEGDGIAASDLPHICDRFYRTDASRSRETGGAGLGLAICKTIVESNKGQLAINSEKGKGTTVTIMLPASTHPEAGASAAMP